MAKLLVMSAASGAGKTTLKDMVLGNYPNFRYSISATSRSPRSGEVHGEHYFFHTRKSFEQMIANDELVEYNEVHGNYYGTPRKYLEDTLKAGYDLLLDLDVFGKINFDKVYPAAVGILILPPDLEILEKRLRNRKTDSDEVIQLRLENARKEMEFAKNNGKYEYTIVNDNLEKAAAELRAVFEKECGKKS
jgi:guanylate kinase